MAKKVFMKGNDAIVMGALTAGCRAYYGYPITPASEIAHAAALHFPALGGTFIQAESEVAAINMVLRRRGHGDPRHDRLLEPGHQPEAGGHLLLRGRGAAGGRSSTSTAPGPAWATSPPSRATTSRSVKGGGHGNYRLLVLAPNSVQEMCDLTMLAFDLADKYRNPACVLADGVIGQMMEAVELPQAKPRAVRPHRLVRARRRRHAARTWSPPSCSIRPSSSGTT